VFQKLEIGGQLEYNSCQKKKLTCDELLPTLWIELLAIPGYELAAELRGLAELREVPYEFSKKEKKNCRAAACVRTT